MIANIWYDLLVNPKLFRWLNKCDVYRSMLRDESIYFDASTFKPERFMEADPEKKKLMDPRNYIFGFGRR